MDRSYVQKLLANARTREVDELFLPGIGQTVRMYTSLTADEQLRVATAGGNDEDSPARQAVGILRFVLIDDNDEPLLASFAEAAAFLSALDPDDIGVLMMKLMEFAQQQPEDADEVGKAS